MLGWQAVGQRLVELGLDADVADAYLRLLMQGPTRPAAFAKQQAFSRSGAYRLLEHLAELGLAKAGHDRPVVYEAAEPATLLEMLEDMNQARAEAIEQAKKDLEPVFAAQGTHDVGTFRHLIGPTACNEELHRLLDHAAHEVLMVDTGPPPRGLQPINLWPRLERMAQSGCRQRVVVSDGTSLPHGPAHIPVRQLATADSMRFLIADRRSTFLCITDQGQASGHGPFEECLTTSAIGLVETQIELFERLWAEGSPLSQELPHAATSKASQAGWQRR